MRPVLALGRGKGCDVDRTQVARLLQAAGEGGCWWSATLRPAHCFPANLHLPGGSLLFMGVWGPHLQGTHLLPGWGEVPQRPAQGAISNTGLGDQ